MSCREGEQWCCSGVKWPFLLKTGFSKEENMRVMTDRFRISLKDEGASRRTDHNHEQFAKF